jgi:hypothetical protein
MATNDIKTIDKSWQITQSQTTVATQKSTARVRRLKSSGMLRLVDVSKDPSALILKIK